MSLIVETGVGVPGANSYVSMVYAANYLSDRNSATAWLASTNIVREAALIEATSYIDLTFGHIFKGTREFTNIAIAASGLIRFDANPEDGDTVGIAGTTITFNTSSAGALSITIGATAADSMAALVSLINSTLSATVTAAVQTDTSSARITATDTGIAGNELVLTASAASVSGPTLSGGSEGAVQPLEFPRTYLYDTSGYSVLGVPEKLKQATVEYAERARAATLLPDPTYDANGRLVTRESKKVGPIESETRWTEGGDIVINRKYPFADRMLREYLAGAGGVTR